jgi:ABC-type Zn uptake system ZnuABC Zn-binding protein ZnuA
MTVSFERVPIKVEKEQEFARLKAAVEQAFLPTKVEQFLKQLDRKGIRVRDFDAVLAQRLLESVVAEAGLEAKQLYESLPVSDQAQMREFYLSKLETVDQALRHKFKKLYQYY